MRDRGAELLPAPGNGPAELAHLPSGLRLMTLIATIIHRLIGLLFIALVVAVVAVFTVLAPYADRRSNQIAPQALPAVDDSTRAAHARLTIVDLHADPLLWPRDPTTRGTQGHTDVPRLIEGRVALQIFGVVTQVPPNLNLERNPSDQDRLWMLAVASRWPFPTWTDRLQRALHQAGRLERAAQESRGQLLVIRTVEELDTYLRFRARGDTNRVAGVLALEGLHPLRGNLARLDTLFQAGFRVAGLTHFFDNEIGGSSAGETKGGLTEFGREVVARMEQLGMVVDLAHASPAVIRDVAAMARKPVLVSHTGAQAVCPGPRNLSDEEMRAVARTRGVIGIGFWGSAVCDISPAGIARSIRHVADLVGADHVALGSDFDGAVTTAFDASQLAQVTQALRQAGFTPVQLAAIMGGNALRVLRAGLPAR